MNISIKKLFNVYLIYLYIFNYLIKDSKNESFLTNNFKKIAIIKP